VNGSGDKRMPPPARCANFSAHSSATLQPRFDVYKARLALYRAKEYRIREHFFASTAWSPIRQNRQDQCVLVEEDLAFPTFDATTEGLDTGHRRACGDSADRRGLPGTDNGRKLGLN
jgi:hypothetical protein